MENRTQEHSGEISRDLRRSMAIEAARLACAHAATGDEQLAARARRIMSVLRADRRMVV